MMASLWCLDPLFHHQLKKKLSKLDPPPPPPTKLSGWVIMFYVRCPISCARKPPRANNNSTCPESGRFDLRHHAVLETLSAADNISWQFGPRSGPTKCLCFYWYDCAVRRPICEFVGLIQQSRGTYIYRRVVRKANSDMSRIISRSSKGRKIHP